MGPHAERSLTCFLLTAHTAWEEQAPKANKGRKRTARINQAAAGPMGVAGRGGAAVSERDKERRRVWIIYIALSE